MRVPFLSRAALVASVSILAVGCSTDPHNGNVPSGAAQGGLSLPGYVSKRLVIEGSAGPSHARTSAGGGWISAEGRSNTTKLLYVSDGNANKITIYKANSNGKVLGEITDGLNEPYAIVVDKQGDVFAANFNSGVVTGYRPGQTTPYVTYSQDLSEPIGLAIADDGTLYVANTPGTTNPNIVVYPPNSTTPSRTLLISKAYSGSMSALALDARNNLFAAFTVDYGSIHNVGYVVKFPAGSSKPRDLKLQGLAYVYGLTIDRHQNIIATSWAYGSGCSCINVFPHGATSPSRVLQVSNPPEQIALDKLERNLYVGSMGVGSANGSVVDFDYATGQIIKSFTSSGPMGGVAVSPRAAP